MNRSFPKEHAQKDLSGARLEWLERLNCNKAYAFFSGLLSPRD